jgi:tRNA pseudouridine55 synthase
LLHGWIVLDKPLGLGSTSAVGAIKRLLREAEEPKTKVGHGGTLDPLASGVLPIGVGEATKLAGRMLDATKEYEFTIAFGTETDTLDAEGSVIATSVIRPAADAITQVLGRFTGQIAQVPPAYSALKIDGKPAYARARAGENLQMEPRTVTICNLGIWPDPSSGDARERVTLRCTVSKGTYIRSLARDIARALGTVGHVSMLRRTRAGPFSLKQAVSLDFLAELARERALTRAVLPLQAALDDIPALRVTPGQASLLRQGQRLVGFPEQPGLQLAMDEDRPVALVEAAVDGLRVVRGFNL